MPRPERIILPDRYPECCAVCPLMGTRPQEELQPGDKWTHICVWQDRLLSGRGSKQANPRCRCGKRWWHNFYLSRPQDRWGNRYYLITPSRLARFGLSEQTIFDRREEE